MKCPFRTTTKYTKRLTRYRDGHGNHHSHTVEVLCKKEECDTETQEFAECLKDECPCYLFETCEKVK